MTADPWSTRIDFARVLADIAYMLGEQHPDNTTVREPCSTHQLADHLQVARGTLRGWLDGSEPRHADGEKLLDVWCRLTGKARTFAPVGRYVYSASKVTASAPHKASDKPRAAAVALHAVCIRWAA